MRTIGEIILVNNRQISIHRKETKCLDLEPYLNILPNYKPYFALWQCLKLGKQNWAAARQNQQNDMRVWSEDTG